jgi:hypothetical protein
MNRKAVTVWMEIARGIDRKIRGRMKPALYSRPVYAMKSRYETMKRLSRKYAFSTRMSQTSREYGKFGLPRAGSRCHSRSGLPTSTVTNRMHMMIAAIAISSRAAPPA